MRVTRPFRSTRPRPRRRFRLRSLTPRALVRVVRRHSESGRSTTLVLPRSAPLAQSVESYHPHSARIEAPTRLLPGVPTPMRRFWFAVVNAVTLSSLAAGMVAIFLASRGRVSVAAGCLLACVVLDGLDGALARKLKVSSPFGTQMDSLADMCSFGLATAVVVFASLDARTSPWLAGAACVAVTCAAALRLARFNVSARSSEYFIGVPTTISAATLSVGVLLYPQAPGALVVFAVAALAMAMVSSFPYLTLAKLVRMPWLLAVGAALSLFDLSLGFGVSVGVYLLSGPVLWWRTRPAPHADPSSLH